MKNSLSYYFFFMDEIFMNIKNKIFNFLEKNKLNEKPASAPLFITILKPLSNFFSFATF